MLMIVFGAGCLLLSVLFHAASLLHLGLPLLYALIVPTLFSGWYYSHYALANGIWYAQIVSACPGTDFVGRVAGAENSQCYSLMRSA